jgi:hypothetical protein
MIQIAIIKTTIFNFENLDNHLKLITNTTKKHNHNELKKSLNDCLWNQIKHGVEFKTIDKEELLNKVADFVYSGNFDESIGIQTETVLDTPKKIYVMSHYSLDSNVVNELGSLFSPKRNIIKSNIVLYAYQHDINTEDKLIHSDINVNDITRILRRLFYNSCIKISYQNNNPIITKCYFNNINYLIHDVWPNQIYKKLSTKILKYELDIFYPSDNLPYCNKIVMRMINEKFYGDAIIVHYMNNFSEREFKRLNVLSYGNTSKRDATIDEINKFTSKYDFIENRMNEWKLIKDNCMLNSCSNKINLDDYVTCSKCFRLKLCSSECFNKFILEYHPTKECINL